MLRIDFDEKDDSLGELDWNTWFTWFEKNKLALLMSDDSRFNKLVSRKANQASGASAR